MLRQLARQLLKGFRRTDRRAPQSLRAVPRLERLEDRTVPATVTVNVLADTAAVNPIANALDANGNISLRSAIQYVDAIGE